MDLVLSRSGLAVHVSVKLPPEIAEQLDALADTEGVRRSVLVRRALDLLLDDATFAATAALRLLGTGPEVDEPEPDDLEAGAVAA
jgi:predicted DNA-binding protein